MNNTHRAIINGNIERKKYFFYTSNVSDFHTIREVSEIAREEILWEGELDLPIMNRGDVIHIKDLDIQVIIKSCLRTTDNKFIYSTYHTTETIEDDITKASEEEAERYSERYKARLLEEKANELERYDNRTWFEKLFK